MVQEIYVLRHAHPDRTTTIPYNVPPGPPLTTTGRAEALQAAHWLSEKPIDMAYVSPFLRTRQTAAIVSEHIMVPFSYVESIRESSPGEQHPAVRTRIREFFRQRPVLIQPRTDDDLLKLAGLDGEITRGLSEHAFEIFDLLRFVTLIKNRHFRAMQARQTRSTEAASTSTENGEVL